MVSWRAFVKRPFEFPTQYNLYHEYLTKRNTPTVYSLINMF